MKSPALTLISIMVAITGPFAQKPASLTLSRCYALAEQNYPLVRQRGLIAQTTSYTIENIEKGYWPQLTINGQASYQSAVTEIPIKIPGISIPSISKDQYKLYGEATETLYDGGMIRQQKQLQRVVEEVQQGQLQSTLFQLHGRINQLFFGTLLIDEQLTQCDLLTSDIQTGLRKVRAAIENGTALRINADVLQADLLKNEQRIIELRAARKSFTDVLSLFINVQVNDSATLVKPSQPASNTLINRPELQTYDAQNRALDLQQRLLDTKAQPRLAAFVQGGAGRPALNFLSNNFEPYYIGGLRLIWSPSTLFTLKKDKAILGLNKENIDVQKETFLFNVGLEMKQENAELAKYQQLLGADDQIIALRSKIKAASLAQLENGVIDSNDFLREVNAEDQARQNRIIHELQLLSTSYNLQTTTGNINN